jgi:hypothetical protein
MKSLSRATRSTHGRGKQFLTEDFASKFGLSDEQTQLVQKMKSGRLSRAAGGAAFEKMEADQKFNKMGAKGILDHLENLIKKLIMAPIMAIYKVLTWRWSSAPKENFGGGDGAGFTKNPNAKGKKMAFGGSVVPGMEYLVGENGPEKYRATGAGSITPNNKLGSGDGDLNLKMSINLNGMDERAVRSAFSKAEGKTMQVIRRRTQRMMT